MDRKSWKETEGAARGKSITGNLERKPQRKSPLPRLRLYKGGPCFQWFGHPSHCQTTLRVLHAKFGAPPGTFQVSAEEAAAASVLEAAEEPDEKSEEEAPVVQLHKPLGWHFGSSFFELPPKTMQVVGGQGGGVGGVGEFAEAQIVRLASRISGGVSSLC